MRKSLLTLSSSGFSLIELIITLSIIGILAATALSAFYVYRDDAEFTKAQSSLRNARVALEAGLDDMTGVGVFDQTSGAGGGPVGGGLATAVPGLNLPPNVQVRVQLTECGFEGKFMSAIYAYACQPDLVTWWLRTCGDFDIMVSRADAPGIC